MNLNPMLSAIIDNASAAQSASDDYINPDDGLKYCGKCHTPKEAYFPEDQRFCDMDRHPTLCKCASEKKAQEDAERREFERMSRISLLRSEAFHDIPAASWRFDKATTTEQLSKARTYAECWDDFSKDGIGLLLFGDVGTGKSYAAGCIANALIERMNTVLFVPMSDVVNRMQGNFGADRENYMKYLMRPDLLILDDLGAERNTSFGKERVFDVINRRLLSHKPMIITTNISLATMKAATDLDDKRIYDRILQICMPIQFSGNSFRRGISSENMKKAVQLFSKAENGSREGNLYV